jgi:type IV secretory pathway VirB9-like protein
VNPRRRRRLTTQRKAHKAYVFLCDTVNPNKATPEYTRRSVFEARETIQDAVDAKDAIARNAAPAWWRQQPGSR